MSTHRSKVVVQAKYKATGDSYALPMMTYEDASLDLAGFLNQLRVQLRELQEGLAQK